MLTYQRKAYLYKDIYEKLKGQILRGILKPGEKLPSKRKLAEQLEVSVNTIMLAFEQLLAEGYIYAEERRGYFVENIPPYNGKENQEHSLPSHLKEMKDRNIKPISLSHMSIDMSLFPFKEWLKCEQQAISHKEQLSDFPPVQGPYDVRQTIAQIISFNRSVRCEPEQIVLHSTSQLLMQQLLVLLGQNNIIAVENPGYARNYKLFKQLNYNVQTISLDDKGLNVDELQQKSCNIVHTTPSHQFPTGVIMPISRRFELLNWAYEAPDRYIIEDDYDSEFKYKTDYIPSLQSLDAEQRVIYTGTFSKTLFPGIRISYMVLPIPLLEAYRKQFDYMIPSCNSMTLYTLHYFIRNGYYHKHLKKMHQHFAPLREELVTELKKRFGRKIIIEDVPAGLHFFTKITTSFTYEEIIERANKEELELFTVKRFWLKDEHLPKNGQVHCIIGFANLKYSQIHNAVERLYKVMY